MSRVRKLALGLAVALMGLAAVEIGLRLVLKPIALATIPAEIVQKHVAEGAMRHHPTRGWTWAQVPSTGLGINSHGFRYAEVPVEKPAGTFRSFSFGDSQTYGAGVDADQTWTAYAERAARAAAPGRAIEMHNAGISGYNSLQVLRLIREEVLAWDPDLLIIDCRTYDAPRDSMIPPLRGPLAVVDEALFHSRIYYLLRQATARAQAGPRPMKMAGMEMDREELKARFGNHEAIVALAEARGIGVMFLDYPFWDQQNGGAIGCLAKPEELPAGVPVARACEALQQSGQPGDALFFDNNHLKPEGNRIVGEVVAQEMARAGFP